MISTPSRAPPSRTAEWVLPGHPDKVADAIADSIVLEAWRRESRALVGVEVAVHRDRVFIDGRIACRNAAGIDIAALAKDVYAELGYCAVFPPRRGSLHVSMDLCVGPLLAMEAEFREVADDQSIVAGYANTIPGTDGMPVEQALVRRLALALHGLRQDASLGFGPDGKVIVSVQEHREPRAWVITRISVSVQHRAGWDGVRARRAVEGAMRSECERMSVTVPGLSTSGDLEFIINGGGDFVEGGPHGDNGLSGKKLVMDFYGPRVPIGGGAMSGKDIWKVDRAGPFLARDLAWEIAHSRGVEECAVTLSIRPGDREFTLESALDGRGESIDATGLCLPGDLRLAAVGELFGAEEMQRGLRSAHSWARWGHFAASGREAEAVSSRR
ncbi:MAG: methionine adenosyltransferase domain-containing protein [Planctomycetota bacterium]|nr:methionine adenosyltransferase domain-containing protein [Planctomycetota bacterium]